MADVEVPPMSQEFRTWYSEVDMGGDPDRQQRRWVGVWNLVSGASWEDIEALIRAVFRTKQKPAEIVLARIRQALVGEDVGSDREFEILCGATLHHLTQGGGTRGSRTALAISTASFGGVRNGTLPVDLARVAEAMVGHLAEKVRTRPDLGTEALRKPIALDFNSAVAKLKEIQNFDGVAQALSLAATSVKTTINRVLSHTTSAIERASDFMTVQDEELQMLWWLIGERSWDQDKPFSAVTGDARPLVFAKELAGMTRVVPGPQSIKALLSRAGIEQKAVNVPAAVNACESEWLNTLVSDAEVSSVTFPIHFAVKRKLETGDAEAWVAGWSAATGVPADHTVSALVLADLFYRERLLMLFDEA
jgi:hypothetical protein